MSKRTDPAAVMLDGVPTRAQLREEKIKQAGGEVLNNIMGTGGKKRPVPKSKAALKAEKQKKEEAQPTKSEAQQDKQANRVEEARNAQKAVAVADVASAEKEEAAPSRKAPMKANDEELQSPQGIEKEIVAVEPSLTRTSIWVEDSIKARIDRIVFERKLAGDKKYSMSAFIRDAMVEKLEREAE